MNSQYNALYIFVTAFFVSGLSGIASFLRSGNEIKKIAIITASLNSGLLGLAISLLWYNKFQENIYSLMGICIISGLTGAAGLDLVLSAIQKGGFSVNFGNDKHKNINDKKEGAN